MKTQKTIVNLSAKELALVTGCRCRYKLKTHQDYTEGKLDFMILALYEQGKITEILPYLRRIETITDKEQEHCRRKQRVVAKRSGCGDQSLFWHLVNARGTKYLLSKHFDVLGWISQGFAIPDDCAPVVDSKNASNELSLLRGFNLPDVLSDKHLTDG